LPSELFRISIVVAGPPTSRISNTGTPTHRNEAAPKTGFIGTWVMLNGIAAGEWLWMTAFTSGLAL
jgi:hypothetical protein